MLKDLSAQAFLCIWSNKFRGVLTLLGLAIGVAAVVAIGSLGLTSIGEVQTELERFGINKLWISTTGSEPLTHADVSLLSLSCEDMVFSPMKYLYALVTGGTGSKTCYITGTTHAYDQIESLRLREGRFLLEQDEQFNLSVAVVEDILADELFPQGDAVGQMVSIGANGASYTIVGVINTVYSGYIAQAVNTPKVYIALNGFEQLTGEPSLDEITVKTDAAITASTQSIRQLLSQQHGGQKYSIASMEYQIQTAERIMDIFILVLSFVGFICMLTGGIGVMNVLMTGIRERRREIGVRKAIGARDSDIALQFLLEALLYSVISALAGIVLGFALTYLGAALIRIPVGFNGRVVLVAVLFTCVIGLLSGVYPAWRASSIPPAEAIR